MATAPVTVNPIATSINKIIKAGETDIVVVVEKAMETDFPWLNLPIIKQIWQSAFGVVAGYFTVGVENSATFFINDVEVNSEVSGLSKALAALIAAEKSGDPNAIQQAFQAYANANSALIHDDGSAPAQ